LERKMLIAGAKNNDTSHYKKICGLIDYRYPYYCKSRIIACSLQCNAILMQLVPSLLQVFVVK
jgi:hypothetical protein